MPSDKRQRQRERHQQKVAVEQIRAKRNKRIRTVIGAVVVAGGVIAIIALVSGSPKKSASTTTTTSTAATSTPHASTVVPTCPASAGSKTRVISFTKVPPTCISPTGVYRATFTTDVGAFTVEMHASTSLAAVNDVVFLARYHFFDGTIFHRVIPGFVVQGGDPTGTGTGGPGYSFTGNTPPSSCVAKNDCYATGDVAMANNGTPSSNGSQFFVILPGGASQLQDSYSKIGHVVSGLSVVEKIGNDGQASGTPKITHRIESVTITQVS